MCKVLNGFMCKFGNIDIVDRECKKMEKRLTPVTISLHLVHKYLIWKMLVDDCSHFNMFFLLDWMNWPLPVLFFCSVIVTKGIGIKIILFVVNRMIAYYSNQLSMSLWTQNFQTTIENSLLWNWSIKMWK